MVITLKIYLQRDPSQLHTRYQALDEKGTLLYQINGRHNPSGESMQICDTQGAAVCRIRGLGFSALSVYSIVSDSESVRLNIAVGRGRAAARFRGISFFIRGDVLMGSYDIRDADNTVICRVGKDYAHGCIQTEIYQKEREILCIASAVCIDSLSAVQTPVLQTS